MERFTVSAGRVILKNGRPYILITRPVENGASPTEADELTRRIATLLNVHGE